MTSLVLHYDVELFSSFLAVSHSNHSLNNRLSSFILFDSVTRLTVNLIKSKIKKK